MAGTQQSNSSSQGSSSSQATSFSGIEDVEALAILKDFLQKWSTGGDADYKKQRGERNTEIKNTRDIQNKYSSDAAFADAAALMEDQVTDTYRKSMPAIVRAIQGAGTSASSMQGLLTSQLATDTAREAAALGAQQKTAYGQISANLAGVLEGLTRIDNTAATNLIAGLNAAKISKSQQTSTSQQSSTSTSSGSQSDGGGGSRGQGGGGSRGGGSQGGGSKGGGWSNGGSGALGWGASEAVSGNTGGSSINWTPSQTGFEDFGGSYYDPYSQLVGSQGQITGDPNEYIGNPWGDYTSGAVDGYADPVTDWNFNPNYDSEPSWQGGGASWSDPYAGTVDFGGGDEPYYWDP